VRLHSLYVVSAASFLIDVFTFFSEKCHVTVAQKISHCLIVRAHAPDVDLVSALAA
jgi:hypothetical protein